MATPGRRTIVAARLLMCGALLASAGCGAGSSGSGSAEDANAVGADGKFVPARLAQDIKGQTGELTLSPGGVANVDVEIHNTMHVNWPAQGPFPVRVGYLLYQQDGKKLSFEGPRENLPADLPPDGALKMTAFVKAPPQPGVYKCEITMLQDGNWWFKDAGAKGYALMLTVR